MLHSLSSQRCMAQNPNAGAGPQAGPQGDAGQQNYQNNNDDVVDGDYTEV